MGERVEQNHNQAQGDIIGRDKIQIVEYHKPKTRLTLLFEKLKEEFDCGNKIHQISDDLKRFSEPRDIIGLEQKLIDGNLQHYIDHALWLKQEYYKKLTRFQFFEPAQEIHSFLLGVVLEKFMSLVYPMLREGRSEVDISKTISLEIVDPIINRIQTEGCDDVMGLTSVEIKGMIYFLTGKCHIKWTTS